jgi:hypothetical protein
MSERRWEGYGSAYSCVMSSRSARPNRHMLPHVPRVTRVAASTEATAACRLETIDYVDAFTTEVHGPRLVPDRAARAVFAEAPRPLRHLTYAIWTHVVRFDLAPPDVSAGSILGWHVAEERTPSIRSPSRRCDCVQVACPIADAISAKSSLSAEPALPSHELMTTSRSRHPGCIRPGRLSGGE